MSNNIIPDYSIRFFCMCVPWESKPQALPFDMLEVTGNTLIFQCHLDVNRWPSY